jgi:transcriptional regulator with AAA-type ATPase domain
MDAELIDATMMPVLHQLGDSSEALASVLVRGLDEMAPEAQYRLVSLLETFDDRLRLFALCRRRPPLLAEERTTPDAADVLNLDEQPAGGICPELLEVLSSLSIVCDRLTDRVEDIPLIATAMLDLRHAAGEGTAERITRAALDALVIYPWPRDLDELDEAVRHAVRTATGESIAVEHLPLAVRSYRSGDPASTNQSVLPLDIALQRYQRRLIHESLEACGGNRAEAARRLGISRARLLRKLEEQVQDDSVTDESP